MNQREYQYNLKPRGWKGCVQGGRRTPPGLNEGGVV